MGVSLGQLFELSLACNPDQRAESMDEIITMVSVTCQLYSHNEVKQHLIAEHVRSFSAMKSDNVHSLVSKACYMKLGEMEI